MRPAPFMLATAEHAVRQYAARAAQDVPQSDVEALCAALGTLSESEALAALDRIQAHLERRP